jgi:hypothetical protein
MKQETSGRLSSDESSVGDQVCSLRSVKLDFGQSLTKQNLEELEVMTQERLVIKLFQNGLGIRMTR